MKFLYSCNLFFSYAITINPTNLILESWFCKCLPKGTLRHWLKNLSRTIVVIVSAFCALSLADKIDKFLGLVGALLCAPLAMTIPALIHLILLAKTRREQIVDVLLVVGSFCVLGFSTIQTLQQWNGDSASVH